MDIVYILHAGSHRFPLRITQGILFLRSIESIQDKVGRVIVDGVVDANAWYSIRVGELHPRLKPAVNIDDTLIKETTPNPLTVTDAGASPDAGIFAESGPISRS